MSSPVSEMDGCQKRRKAGRNGERESERHDVFLVGINVVF